MMKKSLHIASAIVIAANQPHAQTTQREAAQ